MKCTFHQNQIIFRQDVYESWMYDIIEGRVGIYTGYGTADAQLITTLEAGKCFGEIGLIGVYPRSATAVALEDNVTLERLTSGDIAAYFSSEPQKVMDILGVMTERLRGISQDYREACRALAQASKEKRMFGRIEDALSRKLRGYAQALSTLPVFTAHTKAEDAAQENGRQIRLHRGEVLFREGDAADAMYSVSCGSMGVYTDYGTPQEKRINTLGESDVFGEMGLLDNLPRSATVVALKNGTVVEVITREGFDACLAERPTRVLLLMQQLSDRIRRMTQRYTEVCGLIARAQEEEEAGEACWTSETVLRYLEMNLHGMDGEMYMG